MGGWGEVDVPDNTAKCERCGKPAEVVTMTVVSHTAISLRTGAAETSVEQGKARVLCKPCAVPTVFARTQGVIDVLEGRETAAVVRMRG